ncbi:oxidoreductase [Aureibacter tunicatorum]|uniref:NAD(P)-dependent dehydrogenase (Short-subunit alcohol dehydrogenase family) n=1 Tax=Aureibacter tunicatorum TaxID=866807 RepID=A0AAE3XJN2_9BACT|nr:oxidoreductase [Aureibacter tunicatorum]MDR6237180.1 NAD(P)-dependent dehydrogenase (short-subunit alcohol dehydrogenase family) [Aureibacter tunicatorum]
MGNKKWDTSLMPDLSGKVAVITGGNAGLGYEISLQLAKRNAEIVIACRTESKGFDAIKRIEGAIGRKIEAEVIRLDLSDFDSVRAFAEEFKSRHEQLDLLINNAGVVNLKEREETASGLEMHMATNHYGHFLLTGLLYPFIVKTPDARVVTMSSGGHKFADLNFDDLNWNNRPYDRTKSYGDSKLANLLFARILQQRFEMDKSSAISLAAHPGLSATERQQTIGVGGWLTRILAQPVWMGALPALRAATDPEAKPLEYYGPRWGIRGYPVLEKMSPKAHDQQLAEKLWKVSEEVTGVKY